MQGCRCRWRDFLCVDSSGDVLIRVASNDDAVVNRVDSTGDALIPVVCRHPASGYVQGINDLLTPFLAIFFGEHCSGPLEQWTIDGLGEDVLYGACLHNHAVMCASPAYDHYHQHVIVTTSM